MQLVKIETTTNIIGFDFLTDPKTEEFIKFDKEQIITYPGYDVFNNEYDYPASLFEIQINDKILLEKRKYVQFIDVLGEIGGLMEIIYSFFGLICSLILDVIYENKITNELFDFNISKKLVLFKKRNAHIFEKIKDKKNEEKKYDNKHLHSSLNGKKNKNEEKEDSESDINIQNRNINKKQLETLSESYVFDKKVVNNNKIKMEIESNKSTTKEIITKSEEFLNNKSNNDINKENTFIIYSISLIELFISKFYCCCKKRKIYANNLLVNESMNIIIEKLDILNIFKNMWAFKYSNNNLSQKANMVNMSEECSKNLSEIFIEYK